MNSFRSLAAAVALTTCFAACGDDATPPPDASVGGDAGTDTGIVDTTPPTVTGSQPGDGDRNVPDSTLIVIEFSEPMDVTAGSVVVTPGDATLSALDGSYSDGDTRLTFVGVALEPGTEYELSVQTDFMDKAGNLLSNDYAFSFTVLDDTRPFVVSTTPGENAVDVATTTESLTVVFSEPMNPELGTAVLTGGFTTLGDPTWNIDNTSVSWPFVDLEFDQRYAVSFEGFEDDSGNRLDSAPYLIDGFLDFETGGDMEAPVVVLSDPAEAATGVDILLDKLTIVFSEPMDSRVRQVELSDGTTTRVLNGVWAMDRTEIRFDIGGLLVDDTDYTVELTRFGYTDLSGNVLDGTVYLGDGLIDFSTGGASSGPIVLAGDPGEGSTNVPFDTTPLVVQFNSAMDTSITDARLCDTRTCTTLVGTWSAADTTLSFALPPLTLRPGSEYAMDLTGFTDAAGLPLNPRPYLDDGHLDFTIAPPTGDTCIDPLTVDFGARSGGRVVWAIPDENRRDNGATDSCDPDTSRASQDLVIEYEKTTADLAGGGRLLAIDIDAGSDDVNVQVQRGVCDARSTDLLACQHDFGQRTVFLDVGPGTYYIWIAQDTSGSFGGSVSIEELTAWPPGESCGAPYTTADPEYTPPAVAGAPHVWEIGLDQARGHDRTLFSDTGAVSCNPDPAGGDAVVRYDKADAASLLQITVSPIDDSFSVSDLDIEVTSECDPASASNEVFFCDEDLSTGSATAFVSAPAGSVFVWVMSNETDDEFPGARVEVLEIPVADGESCAAARPLTGPGPHTITLDSTDALGRPSCFGSGPVTWYSYTPADNLTTVTANASGSVALVAQDSGLERGCTASASGGFTRIVPAGEAVCIAVDNASGISTLSFSEGTYSGVLGIASDLNVGRALSSTGSEVSWTGDTWMATDGSTLYMADSFGIFVMPTAGGTRATEFDSDEGVSSSQPGDCGLVESGNLFSVDDTTSSSNGRWYRLWDGEAFPWAPVAWDTAAYDSAALIGCAREGSSLFAVQDTTTSVVDTVVYSLSAATAGAPTRLGSNSEIESAVGLAVDDEYFYFAASADLPAVGLVDGIFRLARADIGTPTTTPMLLAPVNVLPGFNNVAMALDDLTDPQFLYFRDGGEVHVIQDPDGATPVFLGPISPVGRPGDYAMAYDRAQNAIFLFETESDTAGRIVRLD